MADAVGMPEQDTPIFSGNNVRPRLDVYVWDMDETLVLLNSLLKSSYAEAFNGLKDVQKGVEIGRMWENLILQTCDDYFFYEQIENYNKPFLDALAQYDDGRDLSDYDFNKDELGAPQDDANKRKLAYRHRVIAEKYIQGLQNILDQETIKHWDELYDKTDEYTDRWLSSARTFLKECLGEDEDAVSSVASSDISYNSTNVKHVNVLVTSGSLIPSLVKCLLFRLDSLISHGNVYSSWEVGKTQCFRWIKERFNHPNVRFCVFGDGWEECEAAEIMRWPFVKIDPRPGKLHRFPGLTLTTVSHYFSVVYGRPNNENEDG
ncbi:eyes absent homolog [Vigna unguiculata]|uniref:protein-tyrosine-phosphatase n=1 Tax=Vigna unguiculata TaxID=3917 RepID=A0A4D6KX55_VIGUN|nr:eyes absent homolog [Vigna unguiculata]XP_027916153.1 eyes absent homolog [Vigna unguiculata]XP_027916154.1 eyes absent homolog [Vigna unguiculata]QCD81450.1 protein-tyrosine phosphatase [Vigna unguiculata]